MANKVLSKDNEKYLNFVSESSFNSRMQEIHKLAKLFGTIHVMPTVKDGKITHEILHPFRISVDTYEDNPNKIKRIGILDWRWNESIKDFTKYIIVWTEDEHYLLDENLNEERTIDVDGKKKELVNNYGRVPVEILRFDEDDSEHFGEPTTSLVENSIDLSIANIVMSYYTPLLIGGVPVLTDFEIENLIDDKSDIGMRINGKLISNKKQDDSIRLGVDTLLNLQNSNPSTKADLKYVSPQTNIETIKSYLEWKQKNMLSSFGVSANSFTLEKSAQSGYAKQMDELETIEARKQDIPKLRRFESKYYNLIQTVAEAEGLKEYMFDKNAKLNIDYPEVSYPKTQEEHAKEIETAIKYNLKSPVDYIKELNPDLTDEGAAQVYEENKKMNLELSGQKGISLTLEEKPNILELPDLRQYSDFDCGVSVTQGILAYYGIDSTESELISEMKIDPNWGTEPKQIETLMQNRGLEVVSKQMTLEEIKSYIDQRTPVILDIQAWDENPDVDYETTKEDGHYVIAIGYDDDGFIFEDPSWTGLAKLTYDELLKRWHDVDANNNELRNWGIAVIGTPKYTRSKYVEIG